MTQDYARVYKASRDFYQTNSIIRDYVELFFTLSLSRAVISPQPSGEWLTSLSDAVLDYWKVGELFLGKENGKIVFCDPSDVVSSAGSTASDQGLKFDLPQSWTQVHHHEPIFIINASDRYSIRGTPVAFPQITALMRLGQSGQPQLIEKSSFGFMEKKHRQQTAGEASQKIMTFRRSLGRALNILWPELAIDMYAVGPNDVLQEAKTFAFW